MLRISTFVLGLAISASVAFSAESEMSDSDKDCVFRAAEMLPKVPGLKIDAARTRAADAVAMRNWHSGPPLPIVVDLDFDAAGVTSRYSYLCVTIDGLARAQRIAR